MRGSDQVRFWAKVEKTGDCWFWTAGLFPAGYGSFWLNGRSVYAHRVAYELLRGRLGPRAVLDHTCRNRSCVNPWHLKSGTHRQNILADGSLCIAKANAQKTSCLRGHRLSGVNLVTYRNGKRGCRTCRRAADLRRYHARKARQV